MAESILNALLFKENPILPDWDPINPQAEQKTAIKGNTAALSDLERLAAGVNEITRSQMEKHLEAILPGYAKLRDTTTANIQSWSEGEIDPKTREQLARWAAEGARSSGTSGSQFANFDEVRTLGRTREQFKMQGANAAASWIAQAASRTPTFDITKMFIDPMEQIKVRTDERNAKFNYDWAKEIERVQPEPWERAVGGLLDWVATTGMSVGSAYAGNIGGLGGSSVNSQVNGMKSMSSWG